MVDMIVTATNKVTDKKLSRHKNHLLSNKFPFLHETSQDEICALIGLMLYRGLYNVTSISAHVLFSEDRGLPMFNAAMSRNRCQFLMSCLCFDDVDSRPERFQSDRFAAF